MPAAPDSTSPLWNADLAPVPPERRTWNLCNIAALWIGMAICIPTYTLASGLIAHGMNWKQAIFTILLGNLIVLIPLTLNAHPGTAYGIPFPVLLRVSFGIYGANIPALMRGVVACGWFGIKTWIGGSAIYAIGAIIFGYVQLISRFSNPLIAVIALGTLAIATLSTNVAANVVSPANDLWNLAPRLISFRIGGIITGVIGVLLQPWRLMADPSGYIFTWLIGYSALLGPIAGIMIADYFVLRRRQLHAAALYATGGCYRYSGGFNFAGIAALFVAILPNLPGFMVQIHWISSAPSLFLAIYNYAWFVGFAVAFLLYLILSRFVPALRRNLH